MAVNKLESFEGIDPIAIVGMDCRFPGAKTISEYWENLQGGVCSISKFSDSELLAAGVDEDLIKNPNYVKANAILEDIELFDAAFFGLTPIEAKTMDPQHRLLLESAWKAIENAGYDTSNYRGRIGLYAGTGMSTYLLNNLITNLQLQQDVELDFIQQQDPISLGNDRDYLTTRISYKLGLTGPSLSVNTACSTSLVAVHLACQSLLSYNCDMALAGAVSIQVPQKAGYLYREGGIASPDGICRVFDAQAKGTLFCSGLGLVVLKRLEDAITDGDTIHAVIRGSAINNDGSQKVSFTAPSVQAQAEVIAEAQMVAGVTPETITYVEAHGTGTIIGDPIEVAALTEAFRAGTNKKGYCALSSVKPNFGHLNRAAGIAGLIKGVLALKNQKIPPTLNYQTPNPEIDFANSPFFVNTTLRDWHPQELPRRAGVTSLGFGGTNAHVVLEEAPEQKPSDSGNAWQLLVLSAKTETALEKATKNLAAYLKQNPEVNLADVAYTLQKGRKAFNHRRVVACENVQEAIELLEANNPKKVITSTEEPKQLGVVFMFSGQGSQYVYMASQIYRDEKVFQEHLNYCAIFLTAHLGLDLREILYPSPETTTQAQAKLTQTAITQPALFAIEYSLAKLWQSWGINPEAMIGHSIGEYVAACLAGVFSLDDALALVAARGKMIQELPKGVMLALPLAEAEIQPLLTPDLSLSVINGKNRCVVSGTKAAISCLEATLAEKGVESRRLHTSHAFHSGMMEPIVKPFTDKVKQLTLKAPQIPYISNVTGTWITAELACDPNYWAKHLRQTVRFCEGLEELFQTPEQILLEVGPGRTLATLALQHPDKPKEQMVLTSLPHAQDELADSAFILTTLGRLWLSGVKIDWSLLHHDQQRYRLPLPTYPFDYQRYWIEPNKSFRQSLQKDLSASGDLLADWLYEVKWEARELASAEKAPNNLRNWLILADKGGIAQGLAGQLRGQNEFCTLLYAGEQSQQISEEEFQVNPKNKDELLQALKIVAKKPIHGVVSLWGLDTPLTENLTSASLEKALEDLCWSNLNLVQSLPCAFSQTPRLWLITRGAVSVLGGQDLANLAQITLRGMGKAIALENPEYDCVCVDLPPRTEVEESKLLLGELCSETKDNEVAFRNNQRFIPLLAHKTPEIKSTPISLNPEATYLITGGTGGLGMLLSGWMIEKGAKNLVLLSRTGGNGELSNQIEKLEAHGAQITVVKADVCDQEQIREAFKLIVASHPPLKGVIHAAGFAEDATIPNLHWELFKKVLLPKTVGAWNVHHLTKDLAIDFFVMFSSMSSLLGFAGQTNYVCANAFLDSLAYYRRANNLPALAVNWGTWGEVGGATTEAIKENMRLLGVNLLPPNLGLQALEYLLQAKATQAAVFQINWSKYLQQFSSDSYPILLSELAQWSQIKGGDPQKELNADQLRGLLQTATPTEAKKLVIAYVEAKIIRVLGLDTNTLEINASLSELGIDSLTSIHLRNWLRSELKIDLTLKQLMGDSTVGQLAESVLEHLAMASLLASNSLLVDDSDSELEVIII